MLVVGWKVWDVGLVTEGAGLVILNNEKRFVGGFLKI